MEETDESDITEEKQDNRPWLFKKGQSGNPAGRPKGSFSLKTYAKQMLENMTEEERQDFMAGLDKKVIWEMAEGKPKADVEFTGEIMSKVIRLNE